MLLKFYQCATRHFKPTPTTFSANYSSINVAVVGSGPAGFYTTQKLLKNPDVKVDIYEKLPVPFGLVRYGVAPDHAEVKNVMNSFTSVAHSDRVDFYGNVDLGQSIKLDDLIEAYHAVVLCYGSGQDKYLNIEGEQTTKNTLSARNFVGWYNGVPEDKDLDINLNCDTACIIGQGNVALDCARILLNPSRLEKTDITAHAHRILSNSQIKRIYIVGRRGPVQVAFTTKELREIIQLNEGFTRMEPEDVFQDSQLALKRLAKLSRQRRRLTQLLISLSASSNPKSSQVDGVECIFKFFSKPHKIIANPETGGVSQLVLQKTKYDTQDEFFDEKARPEDSEEYESIDCGLILRSVGYKALMVDRSLPLNHQINAILNTNGRIHGHKNLYCSGWLATGAVGVIAGTLNSSHITAQSMLEDIQSNQLPNLKRKKLGHEMIHKILSSKNVQVVHFNDWLRIDELEKRLGETLGKTREKFVDISKMLNIAEVRKED